MVTEELLIQKKKKKKKNETFILMDVYNTNEEILDSVVAIEKKITSIFRFCIGIDNAISPAELFFKVYNRRPEELNVYARTYWWSQIQKELRSLRRMNKLFTITKGSKIFVLSSKEELDYYIKRSDHHIASIQNIQSNARSWLRKGKWRTL